MGGAPVLKTFVGDPRCAAAQHNLTEWHSAGSNDMPLASDATQHAKSINHERIANRRSGTRSTGLLLARAFDQGAALRIGIRAATPKRKR